MTERIDRSQQIAEVLERLAADLREGRIRMLIEYSTWIVEKDTPTGPVSKKSATFRSMIGQAVEDKYLDLTEEKLR